MLSRHYYQAAASWVVFFAPGSDSDIASYNDFMHYLTEKQRVAVAKLEEKLSLFLVPPSDFTEKILKVPGKLSISGLILKFNQQMVSDQDPGRTFDPPVSKPGRRIEESSGYKARDSPDFRSHVGPSSGNFTSGNYSSGFTPPHLPPNSIQQQNHGPGAVGFAPQPPLNSIQQQIQEPGISGYAPLPPVQQQVQEVGTSGFMPQQPPNLLQQQNLEQGPAGFARLPPPNPLQQQNLEQGPMGFSRPLPPNPIQQQNLEPNASGFPHQAPSNPTWQQIHLPYSVGSYDPFQNNNFSGNFQLRPELTSNYITAPPLPAGPPPPRAAVPPPIPQPASMPFQFGTNYISYEQNSLEQIQNLNPNLNPNTNMNPIMNSIPLPSYTSQAPPMPSGIWGLPVGQAIASVPPAVQQQQQMSGASGGVEGENATEPDQHKRVQATMQLAAVLLQQMQQQASAGTDRR